MKTVNDLLEQAISETLNLNNNEVFLLKDLFKGYEWNRISRGDRLLLGTLFLNHQEPIYIQLRKLLLSSKSIEYVIISDFYKLPNRKSVKTRWEEGIYNESRVI